MSWNARHFKPHEVNNPFTMSPLLLQMLDDARRNYGYPITITGSWRPLDDSRIRSSAHQISLVGIWEAADLRCHTSRERAGLLPALLEAGFKRIGIYDKHIHVDVATEPRFDQDVIWLGVSK